MDSSEHSVTASDSRFPVNKGYGGVVAVPFIPQLEGEKVDAVVTDVLKGGVDGGKLEGVTVLGDEAVFLVIGGVFAHRNTMVCRHM